MWSPCPNGRTPPTGPQCVILLVAPAIYVGERFGIMPEIFIAGDELSPAVFMNDEHRLKVRHFLAVWVNDFRPLHKSNVGG